MFYECVNEHPLDPLVSSMFHVERELHVFITDEYPLLKLFAQIDELDKYYKEIEKQNKKR